MKQRLNSTVERTVADFEDGTLDTDVYAGGTGNFSVQSSVVESGNYALKADPGTNTFKEIYTRNGEISSYPQRGDVFSFALYATDKSDKIPVYFAWVSDTNGSGDAGYSIGVSPNNDNLALRDENTSTNLKTAPAPLSNYVNEWIYVTVEWGLDNSVHITAEDSNGQTIGTLDVSNTGIEQDTGKIGFGGYNPYTAPVLYYDSFTLTRRETEARTNTQKGTTQLGNEVVPSGSIQTGPTTSSTNAKRAIYQDAPVDNTATQGSQSKLTLLQSGLHPAMFMERTLDGQGGAYGHQLQAPLGRFARINANLSWEYDTLADVPNWNFGGVSGATASLTGSPRRIQIDHTSSASGVGSLNSPVVITRSEPFRVVFSDVSFTDNDDGSLNNRFALGINTADAGDPLRSSTGYEISFDAGNNSTRLRTFDSGSKQEKTTDHFPDYSTNHDFAIEYTQSEQRYIFDGTVIGSVSQSFSSGAFTPYIGLESTNGISNTLEVQKITVEPLPEVLQ